MKDMKAKAITLLIAIFAIVVFGCEQSSVDKPVEKQQKQEMNLSVVKIEPCGFEEATVNLEAAINNCERVEYEMEIAPELENLIDDKVNLDMVRADLDDHNRFVDNVITDLMNYEMVIVSQANDIRAEVVQRFERGSISLNEAQEEINKINSEFGAKLQNSKFFVDCERNIYSDRRDFIENVESLLPKEKQEIWYKFTLEHADVFYGPPT